MLRRIMAWSALAVLVAVLASGCSSGRAAPSIGTVRRGQGAAAGRALSVGHDPAPARTLPVVRLGLMADLCDGPGLAAADLGYFGQELGSGLRLDPVAYASAAAESAALAAGRLDAAYVDPVAAVTAWQASGGQLRIISGAGAGGSELVAGRRFGRPGQLAGKVVVVPPGGGQAVALASWLSGHGVRAVVSGRVGAGAAVAAVAAGRAAAAWLPAPFDAQAAAAGVHVLARSASGVSSAVLVVRSGFLAAHPGGVEALLRAQVRAGLLMVTDPVEGRQAAAAELTALGVALPARIVAAGFTQVRFTDDPGARSLLGLARQAAAAGMLRPVRSLGGLLDLGPLNALLRASGQLPVRG